MINSRRKKRVRKESEKIGKIANQRGSNNYNCPVCTRGGKKGLEKKLANVLSFFHSNEDGRNGYYFPLLTHHHIRG